MSASLEALPDHHLAPALAEALQGDSRSAAPFQSLATEITIGHIDKGRRGLAICGAASGAGVSFVTAGLGVTLARMGIDVLIVDANLRQPSQERLVIPTFPAGAGLLQYLRGEVDDVTSVARAQVLPGLSILYAGGEEAEPQELFDSLRFKHLISSCMRDHQLTIIDTPPASRCAEARRIAAIAGYAAIIGRRDVSFMDDLSVLTRELTANGVNVIGSVFNAT
jgi:protein-tyrosine kinase